MILMWEGEYRPNPRTWPDPTEPQPPLEQLMEEANDGVVSATDGCRVEPDGVCEHNHPSWLLRLGMIGLGSLFFG